MVSPSVSLQSVVLPNNDGGTANTLETRDETLFGPFLKLFGPINTPLFLA